MSEPFQSKELIDKIDRLIDDLAENLLILNNMGTEEPKREKNILPDINVDLSTYKEKLIDPEIANPNHESRGSLAQHYETLRYEFRGKSELLPLFVICIAYLRRRAQFADQALTIFFRIIDTYGNFIIENTSNRYKVSILRTLAEYGRDDRERLVSLNGYIYTSLIRAYETERALDGGNNKALSFSLPSPGKSGAGRGLFYKPGHDDALSSVNTLLLNACIEQNSFADRLLIATMADIKNAKTIFKRIDNALHKVEGSENKIDVWSFGRPVDKR